MRLCALLLCALALAACQTTGPAGDGAGTRDGGARMASIRPAPAPSELAGQDAPQVSALLGQPTLIRREADVEIWQYQGEACVLDLFLYPQGGVPRVRHLEARDRVLADSHPLESCLDQVMTEQARRPA